MRTQLIAALTLCLLASTSPLLEAQQWIPHLTYNNTYPGSHTIRHHDGRVLIDFLSADPTVRNRYSWVEPSRLLGVYDHVKSFPIGSLSDIGDINGDGVDDVIRPPERVILSPFKVPCEGVRMYHLPLAGRVLDVDADGNADYVHTCARDVLHILWGDQERPFERYSTIVAENFSPIAGARIITSFAIIDDALMVVRQDLSLVGGLVRNTYDLLVCDEQHLKEHRTQVETVSVDTCLAPDNGEFGLLTLYSDSLLWIGTAEPGSRYLLRASRHAIDLHSMDPSVPSLTDTTNGGSHAFVGASSGYRIGHDNSWQLVIDYDKRIFASERDLLFYTVLSEIRQSTPYDWTSIDCELLEITSFDPLRILRVPIKAFDVRRRPTYGFRLPDLDGDGRDDILIGFGIHGVELKDRGALYLSSERP